MLIDESLVPKLVFEGRNRNSKNKTIQRKNARNGWLMIPGEIRCLVGQQSSILFVLWDRVHVSFFTKSKLTKSCQLNLSFKAYFFCASPILVFENQSSQNLSLSYTGYFTLWINLSRKCHFWHSCVFLIISTSNESIFMAATCMKHCRPFSINWNFRYPW